MQPLRLIVKSDVSTWQTDRLPTQCTDQTRLENNQENAPQLRAEQYLHNSYNNQFSTTQQFSPRLLGLLCFHILCIFVLPFICFWSVLALLSLPFMSFISCLFWHWHLQRVTVALRCAFLRPSPLCLFHILTHFHLTHPSFGWPTTP